MRKLPAFNAAAVLALFAVFAWFPADASGETWESLSKRLIETCEKGNRSLNDCVCTMRIEVPATEGAFSSTSTVYRKGERYRVEISIEGVAGVEDMADVRAGIDTGAMQMVIISDGTSAWLVNPLMGKSQLSLEDAEKYRGNLNCIDYIPVGADIIGSEKVGENECYVLSVLDDSSGFAKLWIDQGSLLLRRAEMDPQEGVTSTMLFSDYRTVAGDFEMAFTIETYSGEDLIMTTRITSLEVDKKLTDELFDPDKIELKE